MTTFYVVRHGQTVANAQNLKQGTILAVTHLNSVGKQQAQTLHDTFDISFADRLIVALDRTGHGSDFESRPAATC